MKKFIMVLMCAIAAMAVKAQGSVCPNTIAGDTLVNAGTVTKPITVTGGYSSANVQVVLTKISGTVGGTTRLQGSVNNADWEDIGSAYTNTDVASQAKMFTITGGVPYVYLRVRAAGTGTMSARVKICYTLKKFQTQ
jgi:hypothetical protein